MECRASHPKLRSLFAAPTGYRPFRGVRMGAVLLITLCVALAVLASPRPAAAWRHGWAFGPGVRIARPWGPSPWALYPGLRPLPGYRFAFPPGAPLSYSDPDSGTTYCLSQPTGFYYECGYSTSALYPVEPVSRMPSYPPPPPAEQMIPQASGVLLFRLPQGAEVAVDGVPIGLSEGLGIIALAPGQHRVVLRVSGTETEHAVTVAPHKILTVTPTAIVATEP